MLTPQQYVAVCEQHMAEAFLAGDKAASQDWADALLEMLPDNPPVREGERGEDPVGDYVDVLFGVKPGSMLDDIVPLTDDF